MKFYRVIMSSVIVVIFFSQFTAVEAAKAKEVKIKKQFIIDLIKKKKALEMLVNRSKGLTLIHHIDTDGYTSITSKHLCKNSLIKELKYIRERLVSQVTYIDEEGATELWCKYQGEQVKCAFGQTGEGFTTTEFWFDKIANSVTLRVVFIRNSTYRQEAKEKSFSQKSYNSNKNKKCAN
ncbi:hypothetical protein MNBD_GAMMA12-2188 [hydrothermal vent metagenome]|uniref:Uncharacterized protein n=1 Tax=hydrothermal vent metagenome TaxID=652676 RepID=A0A3B0YE07_9ZZZZ